MLRYRWPGNVRELENLVRRLAALYPQDTITANQIENELNQISLTTDVQPEQKVQNLAGAMESYLEQLFKEFGDSLPPPGLYHRLLREIEYPLICASLAATKGNQIKTAELLGLTEIRCARKSRISTFRSFAAPELRNSADIERPVSFLTQAFCLSWTVSVRAVTFKQHFR